MLIVLSGLPGVGKTAIARTLAAELGATHVRIDTIEQDLRNRGVTVKGMTSRAPRRPRSCSAADA